MNTLAHRTILFPLLFLLLTISVNTHVTKAATFNVLTVQDITDAINAANTNGEADTINILSPLLRITGLEPGYPFQDGNGRNGLPIILSDSGNALTINGNRAIIERSPLLDNTSERCFRLTPIENFRIFQIASGADVVINDLTMQNGCFGAILNFGQLKLNNSSVIDNIEGGIRNNSGATLILENGSNISDNVSESNGGGIYNESGATLDISYSTISRNETTGDGAGIYNEPGGTLMPIVGATIASNKLVGVSGDGGGLYNGDDELHIMNSTFRGNSATNDFPVNLTNRGGAIYQTSTGNAPGAVRIFSSTIAFNGVDEGGGIYADTTTVDIKNTILTDNNVENCRGIGFSENDLGGNVSTLINTFPNPSFELCGFPNDDDWDVDTMLGPLQDNGGMTETSELLVTTSPLNPAIDFITAVDCTDLSGNPLTEDQRTFQRPFNTNCDAGAVEHQPTGKLTAKVVTDPPGGRYVLFGNFTQFPEGCGMESIFFLNDQQSIPCVLPLGLYTVASALQVGDIDITCTEPPQSTTLTSVTMNIAEDDDVTCTFTASDTGIPLSVLLSGNGTGTVNIDPPDEDCTGFCGNIYPLNNGVGLTAIPDANSSFTGWSGDLGCSGTNPRLVLAMGSGFANTCTAEFTAEFRSLNLDKIGAGVGTVTSSPVGINCGPGCNSDMFDFELNQMVTLTAVAEFGSEFKGWGISCSPAGTNPEATVTMDIARDCTAEFGIAPVLTITKSGIGSGTVNSLPEGINCGGDCSEAYDLNTMVLINAVPDAGSVFAGFGGSADCMDGIVTMDVNKTCDAVFSQASQVTLIVAKDGTGGGTVTSPDGINCGTDCVENFNAGTNPSVTLTPTPDANSVFSGWSGDPDCSDGTVTVDSNITCIATFDKTEFTLTVVLDGPGAGSVSSTPPGINCGADCDEVYNKDQVVVLTPIPNAGSTFGGWTGDPDCTNGVITMDSNITCTARFNNLNELTLNITKIGTGTGMVQSVPIGIDCGTDCQEVYDMDTVVGLTAVPGADNFFTGWMGDADCMDGLVTMSANRTCTAVFELQQSNVSLPPMIPAQAGVQNIQSVTGGTPDSDVTIIWSFNINGSLQAARTFNSEYNMSLTNAEIVTNVAPDDICPGLNTPLINPRILTTTQTNSNGDATTTFTIPQAAAGLTVYIQAVDLATCQGSNVNQENIVGLPIDIPPVLLELDPGSAGMQNTMTATGTTPNGDVRFIWGFNEQTVTTNNICPGFQSGIINPRTLPLVQADGAGTASLNVNVPANLAGVSLVLQAVDITTCTGSNVNPETL